MLYRPNFCPVCIYNTETTNPKIRFCGWNNTKLEGKTTAKCKHLEIQHDKRLPQKCGNCGTYRQVDEHFMVEKCPLCSDDEYDLYGDLTGV